MTEATTTPANAGSDSAAPQPSTALNDPANWDYEDESDNQTTVADAKAEVDPERETDESEAQPDAQEAEQQSDEEAENGDDETGGNAPLEVNVPDDALVTLSNGQKVKLGDLKRSPFFEADYTRDKQRLATERKTVTEQATRIQGVTEAFVNFLAEQIPAEPSIETAVSNPNEYIKQKAIYDAALARIQGLMELGNNAKAQVQELSDAELRSARAETAQKLADRLPFLNDPQKARDFDKSVAEAAAFIGISPERVSKMHRPEDFLLAYYAQKGIKAEQAEKKVQQKVQAAPKATPVKTAAPKGNPDFLRNKEAMRRLQKSGSINDAMGIDFD